MDGDPTLAEFVEKSVALQKVIAGKHFVCTICKASGLSLDDCLKAMTRGKTTNGRTHMKHSHAGVIDEDDKKTQEAEKVCY